MYIYIYIYTCLFLKQRPKQTPVWCRFPCAHTEPQKDVPFAAFPWFCPSVKCKLPLYGQAASCLASRRSWNRRPRLLPQLASGSRVCAACRCSIKISFSQTLHRACVLQSILWIVGLAPYLGCTSDSSTEGL